MFTSLPPRRLRWSAGAAGRSSPNRVPAPHSGMSLLNKSEWRSQAKDRSVDHQFQKEKEIVFG